MTLRRFFMECRIVNYQLRQEREAQAKTTAVELAGILSKLLS